MNTHEEMGVRPPNDRKEEVQKQYYFYVLKCKDENITPCYHGSTTNLNKRFSDHKYNVQVPSNKKYNYKKSTFIRNNGGMNNWYACVNYTEFCTKYESRLIERAFMETDKNATLNSCFPIRFDHEKNIKKRCE